MEGQRWWVRSDNGKTPGHADLKANAHKKVVPATGSPPAEHIKQYLASPSQLVLFDVYDKCANALRTNQVQVVTTDNVILLGFVSKSDKAFKLVGEQFTKEPYGIGVKKGDVKFCEFINKTLKDVVLKYKTMAGHRTPYVPGWDCHGLPIEHKIQEEIGPRWR